MEQLNMSQSAVIENKTIFQGLAPNLFGFKKKKKKKTYFSKCIYSFRLFWEHWDSLNFEFFNLNINRE